MEYTLKKFDLSDCEFSTTILHEWEEGIKRKFDVVTNDSNRDKRLADQYCKRCSCGLGMACQAFTKHYCGLCEVELWHYNTNAPRLCKPCAQKNNLCVQCGAQIDGKSKRKLKSS